MKHETQMKQSATAAIIEAKPLALAMTQICKIVEKRCTTPILKTALLRAENGLLIVTGTDLEICLNATISCAVGDGFEACVDAYQLRDIAKAARGDLVLSIESDMITIAGSGVSRTLNALKPRDFPRRSSVFECAPSISMPLPELRETLLRVGHAMSKDQTRNYLNGVYFYGDGACVATDGHRLVHAGCVIGDILPANADEGAIIPSKAISHIAKLPKARLGNDCVTSITGTHARFQYTAQGVDYELNTKLIDASYPDFQRVIPRNHDAEISFDRLAFLDVVTSLVALGSDRTRGVKIVNDDDGCTLSMQSGEATASAGVPCAPDNGDHFSIGFNGRYLMDIVKAMKGDTITLQMSGANTPCLFVDGGDYSTEFVLMPMRL